MTLHVCSTAGCPRLVSDAEPCPEHGRPRDARWSRDRDAGAHDRFRAQVMRRSGGWCERCRSAPAAVAHHVRPGYEPAHGQALCDDCHRAVDVNAR